MLACTTFIAYSPWQALMGARSSTTNNWGWAVAQRRCLNDSIIPVQAPTLDAKLTARRYHINLHRRIARASSRPTWPTVEKAALCSLPSFHDICQLQYTNFMLQVRNTANKAMDGCVQNFATSCCDAWSTSEWSMWQLVYMSSADIPIHKNLAWWAVTWRTSKQQNCQKCRGEPLHRDGQYRIKDTQLALTPQCGFNYH